MDKSATEGELVEEDANLEMTSTSVETYEMIIEQTGFFLVKFDNTKHVALNGRMQILPVPFVMVLDDNRTVGKFIEPPYNKKRLSVFENIIKNGYDTPEELLYYQCLVVMYNSKIFLFYV